MQRTATRGLRVLVASAAVCTASCGSDGGPLVDVQIDGVPRRIVAEVARTPEQQSAGLMGRDDVAPWTGMVFPFPSARRLTFWMAHTRMPLDIAWVRDCRLVGVSSMVPCRAVVDDECPLYSSPEPADTAIEASPGTFDRATTFAAVRLVAR